MKRKIPLVTQTTHPASVKLFCIKNKKVASLLCHIVNKNRKAALCFLSFFIPLYSSTCYYYFIVLFIKHNIVFLNIDKNMLM